MKGKNQATEICLAQGQPTVPTIPGAAGVGFQRGTETQVLLDFPYRFIKSLDPNAWPDDGMKEKRLLRNT